MEIYALRIRNTLKMLYFLWGARTAGLRKGW